MFKDRGEEEEKGWGGWWQVRLQCTRKRLDGTNFILPLAPSRATLSTPHEL
jgi:hypothetical protein